MLVKLLLATPGNTSHLGDWLPLPALPVRQTLAQEPMTVRAGSTPGGLASFLETRISTAPAVRSRFTVHGSGGLLLYQMGALAPLVLVFPSYKRGNCGLQASGNLPRSYSCVGAGLAFSPAAPHRESSEWAPPAQLTPAEQAGSEAQQETLPIPSPQNWDKL